MIKNNIKITWRKMLRQRRTTGINLLGLSLGIAAALTLFIIVQYEWNYDRHQRNYDHIYRIVTHTQHANSLDYNAGAQFPLADALKGDVPHFQKLVPIFDVHRQIDVASKNEGNADDKYVEQMLLTTADFFDVFDVIWMAGTAEVLNQPYAVVLDQETAIRFFGSWEDAMGKTLKIEHTIQAKVAGIIADAPSNNSFPTKILGSLTMAKNNADVFNYNPDDWNSTHSSFQIYVLLDAHTPLQAVSQQLTTAAKKYYAARNKRSVRSLHLQPLEDLHFDMRYGSTLNHNMIKKSTLTTLGLVGVLVLIMAAINFINLTTAQAVYEGKSIGIRKILGGSRQRLVWQSLSETLLLVVGSVILAVILTLLMLPHMHYMANIPEDIQIPWGEIAIFLLFVTVFMTALSGLYPALVLSRLNPLHTLKRKMQASEIGGVSVRKALVVIQFALAQLLIVGTLVTIYQMAYMRDMDLGFEKDALYGVHIKPDDPSRPRLSAFKQELLRLPEVESVSLSNDMPSSDNRWASNFYFDGITSEENITFPTFLKFADADYFRNYGLDFVAGEGYPSSDTARYAVINETMAHKLGLGNPQEAIGKQIRIGGGEWLGITGVVKDFTPNSLREETGPMIISISEDQYYVAGVKLSPGAGKGTLEAIQKSFEGLYPEEYFSAFFLDESIAKFYEQEEKLTLAYQLFAGLAIIIAVIGLYGMITFMLGQKVKEIGIRKVLGASEANIVFLFSKEFVVSILIAFLLSAPVGYYVMSGWLDDFAYRVDIGLGVFLLVISVTLVMALLTIGVKSFKAAIANPVNSLRDE